ncbi:hypothetical protein L2E82_47446 [Cichorium intybus]|uniref:Uncharacterized protein n=1 Tax=Cichorium intybus TaxID=13427 RepID=A0ACB8YW33_CICIN|nr:hypothetical protein L2E82_47446 [Cichorium intybus]
MHNNDMVSKIPNSNLEFTMVIGRVSIHLCLKFETRIEKAQWLYQPFHQTILLISMALKSMIVLVALFVAASQAQAQLGLLGIININGTIFCSANGNAVANAITPTPPFSNALVQLMCGGNVISSALTNGLGVFNIALNPLQFLLSNLLSSCNIVVASPLSSCNSSLPSTGFLQAPLQLIGNTIRGLLSIINLIPLPFQLINDCFLHLLIAPTIVNCNLIELIRFL